MPNEPAMEKAGWRISESSLVIDTRHLRLRKDRIELPNGAMIEDYYVRESRGFVIVFALAPDGRVILVRQYKHGIAKALLELPAGAIDPDEEPLQCAMRELTEETGYAGVMEHIRTFVTDPTNADTVAHLYYAQRAEPTGAQRLDVSENIDVEFATLDELHALAQGGEIDSVAHVASIYVMLERLARSSS